MLAANHFTALTRPRLVAGIGLKSCMVIWAPCLMATILIGWPLAVIAATISLLAHVGMLWAFRKDDRITDVMKLYELSQTHYSGSSLWSDGGLLTRPKGYGKGVPL